MRKMFLQIVASAGVAFGLAGGAVAGDFTHNFNTDPAADGVVLRGNATWRATGGASGGYVALTDAAGSQQGKLLVPDIDLGGAIQSFTASMKILIGGSTCCGPTGGRIQPADGMSFNFADAADAAVTATDAGGWVANAAEEGTMTGISVCIDTWDNGGGEAPNLDVKVNGATIATAWFDGNIFRNPSLTTRPYIQDGSGNNLDPRTGTAWADLQITLNDCGALTVTYKGVKVFDELPTGWRPTAGRFLMGGRTGGANDNHWVDDLTITTAADNAGAILVERTPSNRYDVPATTHIGFKIADRFGPVDPGSIELIVDGTAVSPLVTSEADPNPSGTTLTVIDYTPPAPLAAGEHTVLLRFANVFGESCEAKNPFAVGTPILFIEAEDYNFSSGQFIETFTTPGACLYQDKDATEGIDENVPAGGGPPTYRPADANQGFANIGYDLVRADRVLSCDWKIGWTDNGEWYQYTRTFPNQTYKIIARMSSGGAAMAAQLDLVTGDPATANPARTKLGEFRAPATGNWDGMTWVPLKDAGGAEVVTRFRGKKSVRFTILPGNLDWNYLAFVPVTVPAIRPVVTEVLPADGSTVSSRSPLIKATILHNDTGVNPSSVHLVVNGAEVDETVTQTTSGDTTVTTVTYRPPGAGFPAFSRVNVHLSWFDDDAIPAPGSKDWSFSVGVMPGNALFIESEDHNYSNDDGSSPGQHANFGDPDGSLAGKAAALGIDVNDNVGDDSGACCGTYRPLSNVEAAKERPPRTDGDSDMSRGSRDITHNWVVGWTGDGEWLNFTRDFGASRQYNVILRGASGCCDEHGELSLVDDPTSMTQIATPIGRFDSASSGGWDTYHNLIMHDTDGHPSVITLAGLQTVRFTKLPGALDHNYIAFLPFQQGVLDITPLPNAVTELGPLVKAILEDGSSQIVSVRLIVDGTDVTSSSSIDDWATGISIEKRLARRDGAHHTARVEWVDALGNPGHMEWSFRQGIYSNNNLFIEAEDFNTDFGGYIPSNPTSGAPFNAKGLYNTLGAKHDVDYHDNSNPENDLYRTENSDGEPNLGMAGNDDRSVDTTGLGPRPAPRAGFETTTDYKVGWNDPGEWRNYTRTFPENVYTIYTRSSSGGSDIHSHLEEVTAGATGPAASQTTTRLGQFDARTTGDWDGFTFVQLKDAAGNPVTVELGGERTLRYMIDPNGNQDHQYIMLVPQRTAEITCPPDMTVVADASCSAVVNFTATAVNSVSASCTPAPGSTFPLGSTTVVCTATDVFGNTSECSFTVTVTSPPITCPANMVVGNDAGQCSAVVNFSVGGACPGTTVTCSPASGSAFPVGTTTVTCTGTGPGGSSSCSFTITVEDREAPRVTVRAGANPAGKTSAKNGEENGFFQLLATDNCDANPKIFIKDANSGFVAGPYSSGAMIKLNPNSGSNNVNKGANGLTAHVLTAGNAQIYATDSSGNVSQPVTKSKN